MPISSKFFRTAAWLLEPWLLLVSGALGLIIVAVLCFEFPHRELTLRALAAVLQLVGVLTVVWDLRSTQKKVGSPGLRDWLREWRRRRPGHEVTAVGADLIGSYKIRPRTYARGRTVPAPGEPIDERVAALEADMTHLNAAVGALHVELDLERGARELGDHHEATQRAAVENNLRENLKDVMGGSIPLSLIGAWWLAVGVVLGAFPKELIFRCLTQCP